MSRWRLRRLPAMLIALAGLGAATGSAAAEVACGRSGVAVQVLGSGGPELTPGRASSSYLIWQDGRARVLVDAGGGSALRFGDAGADFADLQVVLLTHLHADHTADFPALVKASYFGGRRQDLGVLGPAAGGAFPATTVWLRALFGPEGAWPYLGDHLIGGDAAYHLLPRDLAPAAGALQPAFSAAGVVVTAARLGHGAVPAVGYRVELGGVRLAFSGDTNGDGPMLARLAADADLLVAHQAIPEGAAAAARRLHMPPSRIGAIAAEADVAQLLLGHRMRRSLGREAETAAEIRRRYAGPLQFADDLDCIAVDAAARKSP